MSSAASRGRVGLEQDEGAVALERGARARRRQERALHAAEIGVRRRERAGSGRIGHRAPGRREGIEEPAEERREGVARRAELDADREREGAGGDDARHQLGDELGQPGRQRRRELLEGGDVREACAPIQRASVPPQHPHRIAQTEEVPGDAERILLARGGVRAGAVVVGVEPQPIGSEPLRCACRLRRDAEDAPEAPRQPERPDRLEPRARLALGEQVPPGGAAVLGGEEQGQHAVRPRVRDGADIIREGRTRGARAARLAAGSRRCAGPSSGTDAARAVSAPLAS